MKQIKEQIEFFPRQAANDSVFYQSPERKAHLKSLHWQRVSAEVRIRAGNKCEQCYVNWIDDIHHQTYERFGHEWPEDLQGVCRGCHMSIHGLV